MKVCSQCHAVFNGRKWIAACPMPGSDLVKAEKTLCTGCKRMRDRISRGTVYLEGEALASRLDEVLRLIRREEEIEKSYNHSSRILGITSDGRRMVIQTVNSSLAIHIAKQLKKLLKGRMQIYKNTPRPSSPQQTRRGDRGCYLDESEVKHDGWRTL